MRRKEIYGYRMENFNKIGLMDWLVDRRVKIWYFLEFVVVGYNKIGCEINVKWVR